MARVNKFIPSREADLVYWSNNFDALITESPGTYGLDMAQATAYADLNTAFVTAYETANDPSTRTPVSIVNKDEAKAALIANARYLSKIIQIFPGTTDMMRWDLGLTVRDTKRRAVRVPMDAA